MNPTEIRIEALRLAVNTIGNTNKLKLAQEYLEFLQQAEGPVVKKGLKKS